MMLQQNFWQIEFITHTMNVWDKIKTVTCPVKLLYGLKDVFFPFEDAFDIKDAIKSHCEMTALPQCNHYMHVEYPYVVCTHIMKFIDKVESDASLTKV
jgi:pimeloyl-ACP methyl ester carboxylesterase